jgi:hypothetical protein
MKTFSPLFDLVFCVAPLVLASCASHQPGLVLDPIGPQAGLPALAGATGSLRVFSAFDPAPDFNSLPYRRRYSSYTILDKDGRLVQTVANRNVQRESPATVELPAGSYRVVARANGYGTITVPVVIHPNRETVVHLEGSFSWPNPGALAQSNPVRLPHGEIAGWRAEPPEVGKP